MSGKKVQRPVIMTDEDWYALDDAKFEVIKAAREWVRSDMETSTYLERCQAKFELRQAVRSLNRLAI